MGEKRKKKPTRGRMMARRVLFDAQHVQSTLIATWWWSLVMDYTWHQFLLACSFTGVPYMRPELIFFFKFSFFLFLTAATSLSRIDGSQWSQRMSSLNLDLTISNRDCFCVRVTSQRGVNSWKEMQTELQRGKRESEEQGRVEEARITNPTPPPRLLRWCADWQKGTAEGGRW